MNAHTSPILIWFRQDLRLGDHPALHEAHQTQRPIIPVYIWSEGEEQPWSRGGASRWWLWKSLQSLDKDLRRIGSRLILRQGRALPELENLIRETDADTVYWNRRYEPHLVQRDTAFHILCNAIPLSKTTSPKQVLPPKVSTDRCSSNPRA